MKVLQLPHYNQSTNYTCGPAAILSFLTYHNAKLTKNLKEARIAQIVKTCPRIGTPPSSLYYFLQTKSNAFSLEANGCINDLIFGIEQDLPSIVLWHDGQEMHWSNVVGHDKNNIILLDPYLKDFNIVDKNKFNTSWSKIYIR